MQQPYQSAYQLLFRFINIIPYQFVFFATAISINLSIIIPYQSVFWARAASINLSIIIPLHQYYPLLIHFFGEGHINQLIKYYSASSILFLINPFFLARDTSINLSIIIPYQSVFFGEGHVNQLINYSFASFKLSVIDPIFARSISINYFKIIQIQLNFSFVFYFMNHNVQYSNRWGWTDLKIQQRTQSCLPTFIFNGE